MFDEVRHTPFSPYFATGMATVFTFERQRTETYLKQLVEETLNRCEVLSQYSVHHDYELPMAASCACHPNESMA